jgi:YbbR domain-containing protein
VTNIAIEPATVTLVGSQAVLEGIISVATASIDITGATDDVVRQIALMVPPDLNVVGPNMVSVLVSIEPSSGNATFGVSPQWQNLGEGLSVRSRTSLVQVRLAGSLPLLQTVTAEQISVLVDVAGLGAGSYALEPTIQAPEGLSVVSTTPDTLQFEIVAQ